MSWYSGAHEGKEMMESRNGLTDCRKGLVVLGISLLKDTLLYRLGAARLCMSSTWQAPAEVAVQMGAKYIPFFYNRNVFWLLLSRDC